jgi:manganese oxidase
MTNYFLVLMILLTSFLYSDPVKKIEPLSFTPVVTPNVGSLKWTMDGDTKVFHLIAEPIRREFAPGFWVNCWGYNGSSPGPTIEAVEGDKVLKK